MAHGLSLASGPSYYYQPQPPGSVGSGPLAPPAAKPPVRGVLKQSAPVASAAVALPSGEPSLSRQNSGRTVAPASSAAPAGAALLHTLPALSRPSVTARSALAAAGPGAQTAVLDIDGAESVDVRVHCVTFNMGDARQPQVLPGVLFGAGSFLPEESADVYVFSTQESGPLPDWEAALGQTLGRRYSRVASETLMSIHIVVFAIRPLLPHIKDVRTSSVATGVGNVLGNKGGVAVTFNLAGAQILVVGAHFAAHDHFVERRNADFHRICAGLFAAPPQDGTLDAPPSSTGMADTAQPDSRRDSGVSTATSGAAPLPSAAAASAGLPPLLLPPQGAWPSGPGGASRKSLAPLAAAQPPQTAGSGRAGERRATDGADDDTTSSDDDDEEPDDGGRDSAGSGGKGGRQLTRFTSVNSNASGYSAFSNVSRYPSSALGNGGATHRSVLGSGIAAASGGGQSFWAGMSFNTAQRQSNALLAHFDVVLWMGDLNYRIAGNPQAVKHAIDHSMIEVLWANDQLNSQRKKGKVLQGFQEQPIYFAPTFKFERGTDNYTLKRIPAWTDRVLYLVNSDPMFADLKPLYYHSVPEVQSSDHKPVIAGFELSISPVHAGHGNRARRAGCTIM